MAFPLKIRINTYMTFLTLHFDDVVQLYEKASLKYSVVQLNKRKKRHFRDLFFFIYGEPRYNPAQDSVQTKNSSIINPPSFLTKPRFIFLFIRQQQRLADGGWYTTLNPLHKGLTLHTLIQPKEKGIKSLPPPLYIRGGVKNKNIILETLF